MRTKEPSKPNLSALCREMGYSRQAYYKASVRSSKTLDQEKLVLDTVRLVRARQPAVGTRKLKRHLQDQGQAIGRDRLFALLAKQNLLIPRKRRRAYATDSSHGFKRYENRIRTLEITRPNQVYVADITYLYGPDRFYNLALLTDAFSRKIVGYDLSESLSIDGTSRALAMAIRNRRSHLPLIHHSDRGVQYCAKDYVQQLRDHGIDISVTQDNHVYENAMAERVNGILKQEFLLDRLQDPMPLAKRKVKEAVAIYNNERLHMSIDWKTPQSVHLTGS